MNDTLKPLPSKVLLSAALDEMIADRDAWKDRHAALELDRDRCLEEALEWKARAEKYEEKNAALRESAKIAAAEVAATLEFMASHKGWVNWWADGFLGEEVASNAKQNWATLGEFLKQSGKGVEFIKRLEKAEESAKAAERKGMEKAIEIARGAWTSAAKKYPFFCNFPDIEAAIRAAMEE